MRNKFIPDKKYNKVIIVFFIMLTAMIVLKAVHSQGNGDDVFTVESDALNKPAVTAKTVKIDAVEISWKPIKNAKRYLVYRLDATTEDYRLIAITEKTRHRDTDLNPEQRYTYKVNAIGLRYAQKSDDSFVSVQTHMPQVEITATDYSDKYWKISWDDEGVAQKYTLYRSLSPYGNFEKVGEFNDDDPKYFLSEKEDYEQNYYFRLKSSAVLNGKSYTSMSSLDAHDVQLYLSHPMPGEEIDSEYGHRFHPVYKRKIKHEGIDFTCDYGDEIYAAYDGVVHMTGYIENFRGLGNSLWIYHGNGIMTIYAHNSEVLVKPGKKVKAGRKVARAGATGLVTGVHLHFEVRVNYKPVNPQKFFKEPIPVED